MFGIVLVVDLVGIGFYVVVGGYEFVFVFGELVGCFGVISY